MDFFQYNVFETDFEKFCVNGNLLVFLQSTRNSKSLRQAWDLLCQALSGNFLSVNFEIWTTV